MTSMRRVGGLIQKTCFKMRMYADIKQGCAGGVLGTGHVHVDIRNIILRFLNK